MVACIYSLCSGGDCLHDIRKYAHPDFLAQVQCNLGGRTIERVRYMKLTRAVSAPHPAL